MFIKITQGGITHRTANDALAGLASLVDEIAKDFNVVVNIDIEAEDRGFYVIIDDNKDLTRFLLTYGDRAKFFKKKDLDLTTFVKKGNIYFNG